MKSAAKKKVNNETRFLPRKSTTHCKKKKKTFFFFFFFSPGLPTVMAHGVTKKILLGELYQFPVLENVGDFLVDKDIPVRHAVFLRAVCKKTDEIIRADDTTWKRLLEHRLSKGLGNTTSLRPEARRIPGAYHRWLVHTATIKSKKEKSAYWPNLSRQKRWHRIRQEVTVLGARLVYRNEVPNNGGYHYQIATLEALQAKIDYRTEMMESLVAGKHQHLRRNKNMTEMVRSGEIIKDYILPRVKVLVDAHRLPKKPKVAAVAVLAGIIED